MKKQYPKAELMAYYRDIKKWNTQGPSYSGYKKYYFDNYAI